MNLLVQVSLLADMASSATIGGILIALTFVCVVQYLAYRQKLMNEQQELARLKLELDELKIHFADTYLKLSETTVGNELLREFLAGQSPEELVRVLQGRLNADRGEPNFTPTGPASVNNIAAPGEAIPSPELSATWQRAEERLVQLLIRAQMDALTQIANRHTLDIELDRELRIAQATGSELSLIMLDVDHFKTVNDTHGHQAGDEVLRAFAGILRDSLSHFQAGDRAICARYGGDEFAVILPGMGLSDAARIAEHIRDHVQRSTIPWREKTFEITISGGFATYPGNVQTVAELIAAADAALLKAKGEGRNTIQPPSGDM